MKIHFYVDSFGLGHITRQIALVRALKHQAEISVFSTGHLEFLRQSLPHIDVDMVPSALRLIPNGLSIDVEKTITANSSLSERFTEVVSDIKLKIKEKQPDLIVADVPGEVFLAAESEAIPIAAVSNFGWTTILAPIFGMDSPEYSLYSEAYSKATKTFILPFNSPMGCFHNRENVGLLRRRITEHLPKSEKVLRAFGKSGFFKSDNHFFYSIPNDDVETQNYVACAKAIFGKPSYGTISEAIPHGIPLFLKKRNNFPESEYILKNLEGACIVPDDVLPSEWIVEWIERYDYSLLLKMKRKYSVNSDTDIARKLLEMI